MDQLASLGTAPATDLFMALGLPRRPLTLSERNVYVELHPSTSGPLSFATKAPVLLAQELELKLEPDDSRPGGARAEVSVAVDGIDVISPEFTEPDKAKIRQKLRSELLESGTFPVILFQLSELSVLRGGESIMTRGALTIHGRTREQYLQFHKTSSHAYEANLEIRQTDFGLKPLTALMGGLRSDDRLKIRCVVYLTGS